MPKSTAMTGYRYYRARIARGYVLESAELYTSGGFSIQFKTGYYDKARGMWYGIVRALRPVQSMFNKAISDYASYLDALPKGGLYMEEDAADLKEFKKTRANEQDVTLLKQGGLNKIKQKEYPNAPDGLTVMLQTLDALFPATLGLPADFLAADMSGNMTYSLYAKRRKDAMNVLVHFSESDKAYLKAQGRVFMDAVYVLAENNSGRMFRRVSRPTGPVAAPQPQPIAGIGDNGGPPMPPPYDPAADYFRLEADKLAKEYDIIVVDAPMSEDERQEQFANLLEMSQQVPQLLPVAIQEAPWDDARKQEALRAIAPSPPPKPDPVEQANVVSQTNLNNASADKMRADTAKSNVSNMETVQAMQQAHEKQQITIMQMLADIQSTISVSALNHAKAGEVGAESISSDPELLALAGTLRAMFQASQPPACGFRRCRPPNPRSWRPSFRDDAAHLEGLRW